MCSERTGKLTAAEVLKKYTEDDLPMFLGRAIEDMNQVAADGDRPIHVACVRGDLEDVIALIEAGADVNAAGDLGYTPLHLAASQGLLDIAGVLLKHNADLKSRNEFGQTPLDVAKITEQIEVIRMLELAARS